jgi:hypothetical protein
MCDPVAHTGNGAGDEVRVGFEGELFADGDDHLFLFRCGNAPSHVSPTKTKEVAN